MSAALSERLRLHYNARRTYLEAMLNTCFTYDQLQHVVFRQMRGDSHIFSAMRFLSRGESGVNALLEEATSYYDRVRECAEKAADGDSRVKCFMKQDPSDK